MDARSEKRLLTAWFVVTAITFGYLVVDRLIDGDGTRPASVAVTSLAIVLAFVKVRIIIREFMDVRDAPVLLGRITDLWIVLMAAIVFGAYLIGRQVA